MDESELSKEREIQPGHLPEGTEEEQAQLIKRGLTNDDKVYWEPGPQNFKDPKFKEIVGDPKYTKEMKPAGCILDGPGLEIKSGDSPLKPTYQLRLMVYRSQLLREPLEISTTRPITRALTDLLRKGYKVTITGFR